MLRRHKMILGTGFGVALTMLGVSACLRLNQSQPNELAASAGPLSAVNVGSTHVTLTWGLPVQAHGASGLITYTVYQSSQPNIATVRDCENNGKRTGGPHGSDMSATITGLEPLGAYTFNVIASDGEGDLVAYTQVSVFTLAADAPQPGQTGTLTVSDRTRTSATVTWIAAQDTDPAPLQYRVYDAAAGVALDTVEHVLDNGTALTGWRTGITSETITGLATSAYAVNVLVRNASGTIAAYTPAVIPIADDTAPLVTSGITFSAVQSESLGINWPAASDDTTATANLLYRVFISTNAALTSLGDAVSNGRELTTSWTPAITFITADSLTAATTYYVNVFVSDAADNVAAYGAATVATTAADAPVPGGALTFSNVTTTGVTVSWTATPTDGSLQYALYWSTRDNIDTVANVLANGTQVAPFAAGITSAAVTGLSEATLYYFNVLVQPAGGGDTAAYTMASTRTVDVTAPVPGNSGILFAANVTPLSFTAVWTPATDNGAPASGLTYAVYLSTTGPLPTYPPANGQQVLDFTAGVVSFDVTALQQGTTYYANVFVKDPSNNVTPYAGLVVTTPTVFLSVFAAGDFTGNLGGRTGADQKCVSNKPTSLSCNYGTHALLSVAGTDTIATMPATYGFPSNVQVVGTNGVVVATSWADLLDGSIAANLDAAGAPNDFWWSGSNSDGTLADNTCSGFTDTGTGFVSSSSGSSQSAGELFGMSGYTDAADGTWISFDDNTDCAETVQLLCICD